MALENMPGAAAKANPPVRSEGMLAGLGTVVGFGAIVASSCCALPIALGGVGATGALLSGINILAALRPYLIAAALLAIVAGWAVFLQRRRALASCGEGDCVAADSARRVIVLLGLAKVSVVLALLWPPFFEPALLDFVQ